MSTIMKELKAEISRLARKEIKKALAPVQKTSAARRGLIADLRRQVEILRKEVSALRKAAPAVSATAEDTEKAERFWITGKGAKSLRKRLGLTQAEFGRLVGVSIPTVVNWEGTDGTIAIRRKATIGQLRAVRSLTKRTAAEALKPRRPSRKS